MEYTLRIRRYDPQSGEAAYWDEHVVDMRPRNSVLDAILQLKGETDGSIGIRCSCQQGICGSCGVRMNGKPGLACNTHLEEAAGRRASLAGEAEVGPTVIEVEPMGNMPVIRDLIVDMDAVHWKKIQRVTPWLIAKQPVPEREYVVPHEAMVDVTQTMACIQCGACVSDCLSMEVDPGFIGPAALAKAYRFVGDPRDDQHAERLWDLSKDPQGIYDCTHCFNCVEACPKDVAPMNQIMRLRRIAGSDFDLEDPNNGVRHEHAFVNNIKRNGILHEPDLLADSYGGKFHPRAVPELLSGLPAAAVGLARGKMSPGKILLHPHKASKEVKRIFEQVEGRGERIELNLYIVGYDEAEEQLDVAHTPHTDEATPLRDPHVDTPPGSGAASDTKPLPEADATGAAERQPPREQWEPMREQEAEPETETEPESTAPESEAEPESEPERAGPESESESEGAGEPESTDSESESDT